VTTNPYAALVLLAERERRLVDDGRIEELAAVAAERNALIATLPAHAPASARPALERAYALQSATSAALRASLAQVRHELATVDRGRGVARAYAGAPAPTGAGTISAAA
jgi:hypothetical protein